MTPHFNLTITDTPVANAPALRILTSSGVSAGASPDMSVTVVVLGVADGEAAARQLAQEFIEKGRDPASCGVGQAGCVVLDQISKTAIAVAPPIGLRQVFWVTNGDTFSLASRPDGLPRPGGASRAIRLDALFSYMYFHMLPGPDAIFAGVSKLEGGHWLRWSSQESVLERYWHPRFDDQTALTESEAASELRKVLRAAVERSLGQCKSVGAFLSGGLDSSTVAGLGAQLRPGLPSVSMGFEAEGYDEMEYARIAARHFRTRPIEYYVTPDDVLSTLPMIAAAFPEPFGNSSAAAAYQCARIAREHGIERLLAGDGGDELFGGNERYAKQLVFERYAHVPAALRRVLIEPMIGAAARVTATYPIGKAASYVRQANVPLPDRLQSYNFLHRHDPATIFGREILESIDAAAPLRMLRAEYDVPATTSAVNRMLFLDWKFTLHDNDLVKVNTMCQLAGVDVSYPMLDQLLVDFSLRIPGQWKIRNGELRWLYKRAMQNFLPSEIIAKKKHGFGLPFGVWTRTHEGLRRLSEDALASLGERGYFRREFLDDALRLHREGHASYYGELVWILTALELWLRHYVPSGRI